MNKRKRFLVGVNYLLLLVQVFFCPISLYWAVPSGRIDWNQSWWQVLLVCLAPSLISLVILVGMLFGLNLRRSALGKLAFIWLALQGLALTYFGLGILITPSWQGNPTGGLICLIEGILSLLTLILGLIHFSAEPPTVLIDQDEMSSSGNWDEAKYSSEVVQRSTPAPRQKQEETDEKSRKDGNK